MTIKNGEFAVGETTYTAENVGQLWGYVAKTFNREAADTFRKNFETYLNGEGNNRNQRTDVMNLLSLSGEQRIGFSEAFSWDYSKGVREDYLTTRDLGAYAKENGYDGVIIKNITDSGGQTKGNPKGTIVIAFEANQIKTVSNETPTKSKDIRYSVPASEGAVNEKTTEENYKEYKKPITQQDVETLRSIGRKSINDFSQEDIEKSQKWAYKFFEQLGVKSPFFRRWFGDWRAYDETTTVNVLPMFNRSGKNPRGIYKNNDTGWAINSSSVGYDETISHSGKDKKSIIAMLNIDKIIENAVLLYTEVSEYGRGKKSVYTAFMHKFYAPIKIDNRTYLAKMSVEESYAPGQNDTNKKFYHVRAIEIETAPSVGIGISHTPIMEDTASIISISDLHKIVKQYDESFNPQPVDKRLLNKDGTPKKYYHGTKAQFTEFSKKKARPGFYGRGFYFTAEKSQADVYGNAMAVYLHITNPLMPGNTKITTEQITKFLEAVAENEDYSIENYGTYDVAEVTKGITSRDAFDVIQDINSTAIGDFGEALQLFNKVNGTKFDGVITPTETIVYSPEQIKSATSNIGTFDTGSDIRFSVPASEGEAVTSKSLFNMVQKAKTAFDHSVLFPLRDPTENA